MTTQVGKDYKCLKNYKKGSCSYTKGKIYHCGRDGYLNDDYDASWSCIEEWFKEYLRIVKQKQYD